MNIIQIVKHAITGIRTKGEKELNEFEVVDLAERLDERIENCNNKVDADNLRLQVNMFRSLATGKIPEEIIDETVNNFYNKLRKFN